MNLLRHDRCYLVNRLNTVELRNSSPDTIKSKIYRKQSQISRLYVRTSSYPAHVRELNGKRAVRQLGPTDPLTITTLTTRSVYSPPGANAPRHMEHLHVRQSLRLSADKIFMRLLFERLPKQNFIGNTFSHRNRWLVPNTDSFTDWRHTFTSNHTKNSACFLLQLLFFIF